MIFQQINQSWCFISDNGIGFVQLTNDSILIKGLVIEAENLIDIAEVGMEHHQIPLGIVFHII